MYNNIIYAKQNNNMNRLPSIKLNIEDKNTIEENNKQIIILNETIKNMGNDIEEASNELNVMVKKLISLKNEKELVYLKINEILLKKIDEIPIEKNNIIEKKDEKVKVEEEEETELKFIQKDLNILNQNNNDIDVLTDINLIHKDKLNREKKIKREMEKKDIDKLLEKYINDTKG